MASVLGGADALQTPCKSASCRSDGNDRNKVFVDHPDFSSFPPPHKKTKILNITVQFEKALSSWSQRYQHGDNLVPRD